MSSWVFSSSRCLCVCGPWVPGSTSNRLSIALTASSSRDPCLRWSGRISSQRQDHSVCQFSELSGYSEYSKSRSKYGFTFLPIHSFFCNMCTLFTHQLTFSGIFLKNSVRLICVKMESVAGHIRSTTGQQFRFDQCCGRLSWHWITLVESTLFSDSYYYICTAPRFHSNTNQPSSIFQDHAMLYSWDVFKCCFSSGV